MSATSDTQTDSTDSELNVFVAALGLTGNSRYVADIDALADKAEKAIKSIAGMNGRKVDNVVVRDNFALEQELEARMDDPSLPDVQYYGIDWRRMLNDVDETDESGEVLAKGVMQDDEQPVGELMAEAHDDVDAGEFDLHDREDRNSIDMSLIDQDRINRAKARARGKTDERVYNDYFDDVPTVSEAIFLNDGTNRGITAVEAARGINPFVKYPSECSGNVLEVSCNKDGDQIIDWARYLLETGRIEADELTDEQEVHLRETYDADDLEYMGLSVDEETEAEAEVEEPEPAPEPAATSEREDVTASEAQAVAGQPASGD